MYKNVLLAAKLSRIVYKTKQRAYQELEKLGAYNILVVTKDELQAIVCDIGDETYISVRGTNNTENWYKQNFNISSEKSLLGGKVHAGFNKACIKLLYEIRGTLGDTYINVSGHSMGGSVALLLANMIENEGYNVKSCIVFEASPFANKEYIQNTEKFKQKRVIVKNNFDIVPVALSSIFKMYDCDSIYFNTKSMAVINASKSYILIDTLSNFKGLKSLAEAYTDHSMDEIMSLLNIKSNADIIGAML